MKKRILKLSFGLALLCAALMNQSCTKDYGADIAQVKKDLEALQGGQVASLADQVKELNASVTTLQQAKTDLEKAVADITGKDLANLKEQISGMNSTIATIQNAISNIEKDIKDNYATQSWVTGSFATIEAVSSINKLVGELNTRIAALETADADLLKKINDVNVLANAAAIDASKALGDINAVKKDLTDNYYKAGQIDGFIANLSAEDEATKKALADSCNAINGRLEVLKAQVFAKITDEIAVATSEITAAYQAADLVLQNQIDNLNNNVVPGIKDEIKGIKDELANLDKSLEEEIAAREAAIAKASEEISAKIDKLCEDYDLKIAALAGRIVSISVLPTNEPELVVAKLGDQSQAILHTEFLVQPKNSLDNLSAENFTLCVKEGLVRTKTADPLDEEYPGVEFRDMEIDYVTGVVSLTAFINQISDETKGYYFALRADAVDDASEYSVTSDFALAIEAPSIDFAAGDWYWNRGDVYEQIAEKDLGIAETEWTKFGTLLDARLGEWAPVMKIDDTYYTAADIKAAFNLDVNIACEDADVIFDHNTASFGDVNPMTFAVEEDSLMSSTLKNNAEIAEADAKAFVGDTVSFGFGKILINDTEVNGLSKIFASHVLTKVIRVNAELAPITAYWNYIYNTVSAKAEMDYTGTDWMIAIEEGAVAENVATFDAEHRTLASGEVFGPEEAGNNYKEASVFVENMVFNPASEKTFAYDTLIAKIAKENAHSLYKYSIPVAVQQQPFTEIDVTKDYGEILARVSTDNELALESIISATLDPEMDYYLNGLDSTATSVYAAFKGGVVSEVMLNETASSAVVSIESDEDSKVTFPAGALKYGESYTLTFKYTQFNVEYNYTITFTTAEPDFALEFTPYIIDNKAEVRGDLTSGDYTLEQIFSSKLMRVEGEGVDAEGVENVSVVYTEVTPDVVPGADDNVTYTSPISISATAIDTIYSLDPTNLIMWGDYKGREVTFTVQLKVGTTPVGEAKTFTLWTKKPVVFERAGEVSATRLAGQPATFKLFQGCYVYGVQEGEYVDTNLVNQATGEIDSRYHGCEFKYRFNEMSTKINGVQYTLVPEVDYRIIDEINGIIEIIGDNVVGSIDITVPVDLWYYLDYNHTQVDTKYAVIHLNQN